jgi:bla regulator protein BlaR1
MSLLLLWAAGFIFCVVRLVAVLANTKSMVKHAQPVKNQTLLNIATRCSARLELKMEIAIVESNEAEVPMTWGFFRSSIVQSIQANTWDKQRQELVFCHELSHIKRRDFTSNLDAQVISCVNWFNPFVWYALRQQFLEREKACDEMVFSLGVKPT